MNPFEIGLLQKHNLTINDLQSWSYCGGCSDEHYKYFLLFNTGQIFQQPPKETTCVCGHFIKKNCFITNAEKTQIIVMGNCCIKRFISKSHRTCSICNQSHSNRLNNICNACRKTRCSKCRIIIPFKTTMCYSCHFRNNN